MPLKKTVTIREIAKLADVSTATVSLVLNGKKGVSDETRERILKLMQEHNYVNKKAAGAEPQTQVCLLKYVSHGLVAEINQVGLAAIVDQIMSTCSDRNISLLVHSVDAQNVQAVLSQLKQSKTQGVLFLGTELEPARERLLLDLDMPVVSVDNAVALLEISSITVNNRKAVYDAVGHLYELGHRKIGYLRSSVPSANFTERSQGFYGAMMEYQLEPLKPVLISPTLNGATFATQLWLSRLPTLDDLPTAFFADNDCIAIAAVTAFQEYGLVVPHDISVVGVGDLSFSSLLTPPLTTVHVPYGEIGRNAVELLMERIQRPQDAPKTVLVHGRLTVRGSTAPARAR